MKMRLFDGDNTFWGEANSVEDAAWHLLTETTDLLPERVQPYCDRYGGREWPAVLSPDAVPEEPDVAREQAVVVETLDRYDGGAAVSRQVKVWNSTGQVRYYDGLLLWEMDWRRDPGDGPVVVRDADRES